MPGPPSAVCQARHAGDLENFATGQCDKAPDQEHKEGPPVKSDYPNEHDDGKDEETSNDDSKKGSKEVHQPPSIPPTIAMAASIPPTMTKEKRC